MLEKLDLRKNVAVFLRTGHVQPEKMRIFDKMSLQKMKYALVTGASSGMGLEFALQLAERGYGIVWVGNRPDENRTAEEKIRQRTGGAIHRSMRWIRVGGGFCGAGA